MKGRNVEVIHSDQLEAHRRQREAYEEIKELGDCHVAMGNWDDARRCYSQAAVLAPQQAEPAVMVSSRYRNSPELGINWRKRKGWGYIAGF